MDTLKDMIDAMVLITEIALALRFIICCIRESDEEDQQLYKKKKRTALIALVAVVCAYDIPEIIGNYF